MRHFESELQELSKLYKRLNHALEGSDEAGHGKSTAALIDRMLRNGELVSHMEQMDARISQLAVEWGKFKDRLDPDSRRAIQRIAENLCDEASRLRQILEQRSVQIEDGRNRLERKLAEIQKGERFLESVNPVKANYPKFIDSVG